MIRLIKTGRRSFRLEMDLSGAKEIIDYIEHIVNNEPTQELSIIHLKREREIIKKFVIEETDKDDIFEITSEQIKIDMDEDVMLYFQDELQERFDNKCFITAEYISWSDLKGNSIDVDYCIIESKSLADVDYSQAIKAGADFRT